MNNTDIEFQMFKYWTFWKVSKSKILTFLKKKYLQFSCWRACTECNGRQFGQTKRTNKQFSHSYRRFKVCLLRILQHDGVSWSTADRKLDSHSLSDIFSVCCFPASSVLFRVCFRSKAWLTRVSFFSQQTKRNRRDSVRKKRHAPRNPVQVKRFSALWKSSLNNLLLLALD